MMTDRGVEIETIIMKLRAQFFEREFYPVFEEESSAMLLMRRMALDARQPREGLVLAVIGGSGRGKPTATDRLMAPYRETAQPKVGDAGKTVIQFNSLNNGPVALSCRSKCSFKPPFVRKRQGFSNPMLSGGGVDCRTCLCIRRSPFQPAAVCSMTVARSAQL